MKIKFFGLLFVLAVATTCYGQKFKQISGNVKPLKGEKVLNIQYNYDNLIVGSKTESDYIDEKVKKYNSDERGKGDKWKKAWVNDRTTRFQPKFEEMFEKYLEDINMIPNENAKDAKYTLLVKTTMIEPGWNIGLTKKPAFINATLIIFETNNPDKVIAEYKVLNVRGADVMGYDFDSGTRISESYAKLGKAFAKFIVKNLKK